MTDVVRFARNIEEVVYTVGPDTVRKAVLSWLEDNHNAAFTDTTEVRFCEGDSLAVTTRFAGDTDGSPKGPDLKGLDGEARVARAEGIARKDGA